MTDQERIQAELERDKKRWTVRRRISITAFVYTLFIGIFYLISPYILNIEQIQSLQQFNSIIIALIGFNSSIVMLYLGAATYADSHGTNFSIGDKK